MLPNAFCKALRTHLHTKSFTSYLYPRFSQKKHDTYQQTLAKSWFSNAFGSKCVCPSPKNAFAYKSRRFLLIYLLFQNNMTRRQLTYLFLAKCWFSNDFGAKCVFRSLSNAFAYIWSRLVFTHFLVFPRKRDTQLKLFFEPHVCFLMKLESIRWFVKFKWNHQLAPTLRILAEETRHIVGG